MIDLNVQKGLIPSLNERLGAYKHCPALLIEELEFIWIENIRPEHCGVHRQSINKVLQLYPDRARLLKVVAQAIINNVTERQEDG